MIPVYILISVKNVKLINAKYALILNIVKERKLNMVAKYEIEMTVTASYEIDDIDNLKTDKEYAEDLAYLICDEIATAGGVGTFEIKSSIMNVKNNYDNKCKSFLVREWEKNFLQKFEKIC